MSKRIIQPVMSFLVKQESSSGTIAFIISTADKRDFHFSALSKHSIPEMLDYFEVVTATNEHIESIADRYNCGADIIKICLDSILDILDCGKDGF